MTDGKVTNLFWTGGWDSTFRFLQLLLVNKQPVQPYYLIDVDRRSTGVELLTKRNIRKRLYEQYPYTKDLVLPTIYVNVFDIPENAFITESWKRINQSYRIGTQYDWLARYCAITGLEHAELGMLHGPESFKDLVTQTSVENGSWRIDSKFRDLPEWVVFGSFSLPIFHYTKPEIGRIAQEQGFLDILEMSWFCHNPTVKQQPCGTCRPCRIAMKEGMAYRIPRPGRLRYHYTNIVQKLKPTKKTYYAAMESARGVLKKNKKLYAFLKQLKHAKSPAAK